MILLKQISNPQTEVKIFIQENGKYRVVIQKELAYDQGGQPDCEVFDTYARAETYAKDCLIWE